MRWLSILLLTLGCHHDVRPGPIANRAPPPPPVDAAPPPTVCEVYVQAYEHAMACKQLHPDARMALDQSHSDWTASVAEAGLDNPGYDPDSPYEQAHREQACEELAAEVRQLTAGMCL